MLLNNETWIPYELYRSDEKVIASGVVLKLKSDTNGLSAGHRARLVGMSFSKPRPTVA